MPSSQQAAPIVTANAGALGVVLLDQKRQRGLGERDGGRDRSEAHQDEEHRPYDRTQGQTAKRHGHRYKQQSRTCARLQTGCREDDGEDGKAGRQGDHRVQHGDGHRSRADGRTRGHVGTVGHDRAHAQTQSEERMPHGGEHAAHRELVHLEAEQEVPALGEIAVYRRIAHQGDQQCEQERHQPTHGYFQPAHHAARDDEHRHRDEHRVPQQDAPWFAQEVVERSAGVCSVGPVELAARQTEDVEHGPAGNHRIEGEDQEPRQHAHPADHRPPSGGASPLLQYTHGIDGALSTRSPEHDLRHHHRHADEGDANEVHDDERAAAVLAGDVGELPEVPQTHRRTRRSQHEQQSAGPHAVFGDVVCHGQSSRMPWPHSIIGRWPNQRSPQKTRARPSP